MLNGKVISFITVFINVICYFNIYVCNIIKSELCQNYKHMIYFCLNINVVEI